MAKSTAILTTKNNLSSSNQRIFNIIDNYIYLYNIDTFIVIPSFADSVTDTLNIQYNKSYPLSRSAPIFSYYYSGPREIQVRFLLHRDEMKQINYGVSNAPVDLTEPDNDDYVDFMIKAIQAAALPAYNSSGKVVNPPIVALRMGQDIFIKGIIATNVSLTYSYPILKNGKYSNVEVAFSIEEIDPYDAATVVETGSFRGLDTTLEKKLSGTAGAYLLSTE